MDKMIIKRMSYAPDAQVASEESEKIFTEIMVSRNHLVTLRDFSLDPAIGEDFITLLERSLIFSRKVNFTLEELMEDMLLALFQDVKAKKDNYFAQYEKYERFDDQNENADIQVQMDELQLDEGAAFPMDDDEMAMTNQEFSIDLAMSAIFVSETVSNLTHYIQKAKFSEYQGVFYDDSWIIVLCELQSIKHRKAIICRMASDMYIMPSCQAARCVILVLANSDERGLKNAMNTGANFATVLSYPTFMRQFVETEDAADIFNLFLKIIEDLSAEETSRYDVERKIVKEKMTLTFGTPFSGIKEDVLRRFPYYLEDFSDGLMGYKTKQKLLSAAAFQYFATILPIMALGNAIDATTDGKMSVKNVVYSQFFGSILYGLLSANPMMMFQVSSVILLYCQIVFNFATSGHHDFRLLFGLTIFFSGFFLVVASVFNLSKLMIYNTSSVADMMDVFQSITYVHNVLLDTVLGEAESCKDKKGPCDNGAHVLKVFIVFLTIVISFNIRSIRGTRFLNANVREFLSDMGMPLGVIGSTLVAILAFKDIKLEPFRYNKCDSPFYFVHWSNINLAIFSYAFFLAMPLSMLIFMDHNLNIEFLMDPNNKLVKGCATHFDIFIIGLINAILGIFGMFPMQGMFPNTPLHIRQMADIEVTVEQDVQIKTLVRVRDTRLTQLIVGMLIGLSTFLLPLPLGYVPNAALDGLLLVIGYVSLEGNGLFDRLTLFFTDQTAFPSNHPIRKVPVSVAHNFTLAQIVQLTIIMLISFSQSSFLTILFPVFLALLLPVRILLIPMIFSHKYLDLLDPTKMSE